jgi:CDGSH-type Zn-finger protein
MLPSRAEHFGNPFSACHRAALCRCGYSSNKPFCDGSHRTVGFKSR